MRRNYQLAVDGIAGDCLRASTATLLNLHYDMVPHFAMFAPEDWYAVFYHYLWSIGYEVEYKVGPSQSYDGINGRVMMSVVSKNFPGETHAVLVGTKSMRVLHDPNGPDGHWLGKKVKNEDIAGWYKITPQEENKPINRRWINKYIKSWTTHLNERDDEIKRLGSERDHYHKALEEIVEFGHDVLASNAPRIYKQGVVEATRIANEIILEEMIEREG